MNNDTEAEILQSWQQNAAAWTRAVREKTIASRRRVTDHAVVDTLCAEPFDSALDLGKLAGAVAAQRLCKSGNTRASRP